MGKRSDFKRRKNDEIAVYEEKIKVWNKFSIEY